MTNQTLHTKKAVLWTIFLTSLLLCALLAVPTAAKADGALLRFHVVANSDTPKDQADKVAVAEALEAVLLPCLEGAKDVENLQNAITPQMDILQETAEKTLSARKNAQSVAIFLEKGNFSETKEGVISLKEGEYLSLRVIIGEGKGHNCFSVLFPSLSLWVASDGTALSPNMGKRGEIGAVKFRTYEVLSRFFERK